jgi:hypothetical protein
MLHGELYEKVFKTLFPQYNDKVEEYYSNGRNSIRVRLTLGYDVIFSYDEESYNKYWTLESVPSFIKRLTK